MPVQTNGISKFHNLNQRAGGNKNFLLFSAALMREVKCRKFHPNRTDSHCIRTTLSTAELQQTWEKKQRLILEKERCSSADANVSSVQPLNYKGEIIFYIH
jgi:hypothetical protein